jgi:hypothetical protein
MIIFFGWIIFTVIVTAIGAERKIGGVASFFLSLILSPLIGLIIVLCSERISDAKFKSELLLKDKQAPADTSAKEIEELYELWQKGILTEAEYINKKQRILNR